MNLNRVYLNPDLVNHSPIYAARQIIFYHHVFNSVSAPNGNSGATLTRSATPSATSSSDKENANSTTTTTNTGDHSEYNTTSGDKTCPCVSLKGTVDLCCRNGYVSTV